MPQNLDKKKLQRIILRIFLLLALILVAWIWSTHRTVDVDLEFYFDLKQNISVTSIDLTFYREDKPAQDMSLKLSPDSGIPQHHTALRPGQYLMRGMLKTADGKNHAIEQTIYVPESRAQISVTLRD